ILNLIILSINLNLEGKKINNVNNEKYINNENLNYNRKDKKNTILKLESVLKNNSLNNLLIKDNKFIFKIKEEELSVVINIINKIGEIDKLIYLNEENLIQGEGRIK
ncbi:hypothetical protein, partial [Clostridium tarantellae]|uniref:hypothetical protein n=1 Tax=Clostridium tarantellae TaxID=39493 RepID=UPI001A9AF743